MFYGIYLIFIKCFGVFISGKSISLRHFYDRKYAIQQGISHSFLRHSDGLFRLQTRDEGRELETHFRAVYREGMPEIRRPMHASGQRQLRHRDPDAQLFLHRPGRARQREHLHERGHDLEFPRHHPEGTEGQPANEALQGRGHHVLLRLLQHFEWEKALQSYFHAGGL